MAVAKMVNEVLLAAFMKRAFGETNLRGVRGLAVPARFSGGARARIRLRRC